MFRRLEDFKDIWLEEVKHTVAVLEAIPDAAMGQSVGVLYRDLRRMGWHLVETLIEMPAQFGLTIAGSELVQGSFIGDPPASMKDVQAAYLAASDSLLNGSRGLETWSDSDLEREDEMYGQTWRRGYTLHVLIMHQAHHRGQMTVLMRQAGLKVPSMYGPVREGWALFGIDPPKV